MLFSVSACLTMTLIVHLLLLLFDVCYPARHTVGNTVMTSQTRQIIFNRCGMENPGFRGLTGKGFCILLMTINAKHCI